jgi:hypothetical protein
MMRRGVEDVEVRHSGGRVWSRQAGGRIHGDKTGGGGGKEGEHVKADSIYADRDQQ